MMEDVLHIEDLMLIDSSFSQGLAAIDTFLESNQNPAAIAQVCDILITSIINNTNADINTIPRFTRRYITHLCSSVPLVAQDNVSQERVFTALGILLGFKCDFESVLLCVQVSAKSLCISHESCIEAVGTCLNDAMRALMSMKLSDTSLATCMRCLMRSLEVAQEEQKKSAVSWLFTELGNILAMHDVKNEILQIALERGLIELAYRWCVQSADNTTIVSSIWHVMEQLSSTATAALLNSELDVVSLACKTHERWYHEDCCRDIVLSIVSSIHITLSNLFVNNPQIGKNIDIGKSRLIQHVLEAIQRSQARTQTQMQTSDYHDAIIWSGCMLLWNYMICREECGETEKLCNDWNGWNILVAILEQQGGNQHPRCQSAASGALRAALVTGKSSLPSKLNEEQVKRATIVFVSLITNIDEENAGGEEQHKKINLLLLCLVKLKSVTKLQDVKRCTDQLRSATTFTTMVQFQPELKLLWNLYQQEDSASSTSSSAGSNIEEDDELVSCNIN